MANDGFSPSSIGGRYAQALFDLALEAKQQDTIKSELTSFLGLVNSSADLKHLVKSPVFTSDDQLKAVSAVLDQAKLSALTSNFIKTIAKNRRLFAIDSMVSAFNAIYSTHKGEISAIVTSATALNDAQIQDLKQALKEKLGKEPILNLKTDASLIGGLIVKVGSKMIDTSVKSKLNSLKIAMKEVG